MKSKKRGHKGHLVAGVGFDLRSKSLCDFASSRGSLAPAKAGSRSAAPFKSPLLSQIVHWTIYLIKLRG